MKIKKHYITSIILVCLTQLILIAIAHQIVLSLFRSSQADQFITQTRNFILIGDYRSFDYARTPLLNNDFMSIEFCEKHFDQYQKLYEKLKYAVLKKPIFYQAGETQSLKSNRTVCLSYDRRDYFTYFLTLWVVSCLLTIYAINKIIKTYEERRIKESEFNRNKAIAFASKMIAHDLRQPFSMLNMAMKLLKNCDPNDSKETIDLVEENVSKASKQALNLIEDLLNIDSDVSIQKDLEDINKFITTMVDGVISSSDFNLPELSFEIDQTLGVFVPIDASRFSRVITNLLNNALQANAGIGLISISTTLQPNGILLKIFNSEAENISDDDIKVLFQPFFTKGKKGGTGLGLSIVDNIVRLHGGSVVANRRDRGLEFTISLPRN